MTVSFPAFPQYKPIQFEDLPVFQKELSQYQPQTSELTFTNLFIWRAHYGAHWTMLKDWLLIFCNCGTSCFAVPPIGPSPRTDVVLQLLSFIRSEFGNNQPAIERSDARLVAEVSGSSDLTIEPTREHFDYVYRTEDLIQLKGKKYHGKRNHISQLTRAHAFTYAPLTDEDVPACHELADLWCKVRACTEDLGLTGELHAVHEALLNWRQLGLTGGVIRMEGGLKAFCLGEMLNRDTAVVHIEKAEPGIEGLYSLINQQFCEHALAKARFVNREQDLGEEGLRKAKLSYHPDHMVEKYRIRLG